MNRRTEDPLLRQHRSRLMQLVEVTNIRPGRGNGKRRGQRPGAQGSGSGSGPSTVPNSRVTLQDIVRSDPGYTSNIEHLVFPERKNSNPNLVPGASSPPTKAKSSTSGGNSSSGMSRLAEVFTRHYARGSSQDAAPAPSSRKNHVNVSPAVNRAHGNRISYSDARPSSSFQSSSLDGSSATTSAVSVARKSGSASSAAAAAAASTVRSGDRRWIKSQNSQQKLSQPTHQHSAEDGSSRGDNSGSSKAPRRLSPSVLDPVEHSVPTTCAPRSSDRGPNVSILHLRGASEARETSSNTYPSKSSNKSTSSNRGSYGRGSATVSGSGSHLEVTKNAIPANSPSSSSSSGKNQRSQENLIQERRRDDNFLSGSGGTSGELFASGNCSRELSPVRWCDREVDGVYLGRSGWVQVQQRSLDENRKINYESGRVGDNATLPLPRRANVKLADYHCSNSEPGNCPDLYPASARPAFLNLHGQDYESGLSTSPHAIPESFSPPSITPIISPPPAFQDSNTGSKHSEARNQRRLPFGKPPFLPRSNAIVDSDFISPPPSPSSPISPPISSPKNIPNWGSLVTSPTRSTPPCPGTGSSRSRRQTPSPVSTPQRQQPYRLAQAKSLEDQSGNRRSQFVQRYKDSSSSSSSSLGFRSLDSCVSRGAQMPRLSENTDSSIEGYEDGDEDDNPSSSLNLTTMSQGALNSSPDSARTNSEKISPSGRSARATPGYHCSRGQAPRKSPGSVDAGKQIGFNSPSSSSSSSGDRQGRSPTPPSHSFRKTNSTVNRQLPSSRIILNNQSSPDSIQTRVRRSRSLQLPERKSQSQSQSRDHFRELGEQHRVVVKISAGERSNERSKRHFTTNRKTQSTESSLNDEILREAELVTEFLYGARSRVAARNLLTNNNKKYERTTGRVEDSVKDQRPTRAGIASGSYEVYFVPSNAQSQRPRTLQRGATAPSAPDKPSPETTRASPETQPRCSGSTCSFWPYCAQRDSQIYSPGKMNPTPNFSGSMKMSQSYPANDNKIDLETSGQLQSGVKNNSASSSSPASLEQIDERDLIKKLEKRNRAKEFGASKNHAKNILLKSSRSNNNGSNNGSNAEPREYVQIKSTGSSFEGLSQSKISPCGGASSTSSSSSDIWVTTSDRTVTKSPRNAKSSGASTPMEDAMIGSFVTLTESSRDAISSRPGSAPAQREESSAADNPLDPHQRSLSLPKSFLTHNLPKQSDNSDAGSTPWHGRGFESLQRSTPSPKCLVTQEIQPPHTAPASPLHEQMVTNGLKERRSRVPPALNKAQRRAKASSTSALLDRKQDGRQWSAEEEEEEEESDSDNGINFLQKSTEHPIVEATIPLLSSSLHVRLQESPSGNNNNNNNNDDYRSKKKNKNNNNNNNKNNNNNNKNKKNNGNSNNNNNNKNSSIGQIIINRQQNTHNNQESVLKKFRKSFSLRFNKKGSKDSFDSMNDGGSQPPPSEDCNNLNIDDDDDDDEDDEEEDGGGDDDDDDDEDDDRNREPPPPPAPVSQQQLNQQLIMQHKGDHLTNEQKFRFGPLVWRTSKERKKNSKSVRNAKCNSGDSGIQIEMLSGGVSSSGVIAGGGGLGVAGIADYSSESHDTDQQEDTDSPPALRRRVTDKSRPQSELINQILIDKFKADLQNRTTRHNHVRRTNSDLGGQRLLQWDTRSGYNHVNNYRRMLSTPSPIKTRPPKLSPRHSSNDVVTLRSNSKGRNVRTNLRRSLSQPLGINKLSPLTRVRNSGASRLLPGGNNVLSEDEHDSRCGGGGGGGAGGTSDDDLMSDSESSVVSLSDRKKSFEQTMDEDIAILAEAVWDHVAMEPQELAFRAGDVIDVLDTINRDWWWGSCRNEHGWFPAAFVRLRVSQEDTVEDCLAAMASGVSTSSQLRRRTSISLLSNEQVRTSVVKELVQTEKDFVKILRDVAEGYIGECRIRTDMFTEDQIDSIFINIEELFKFQSNFLKDLQSVIDWEAPHKSCVGECFIRHRSGFRMYSEYCNSHPMAIATLQELYQHNRYSKFFEGCRLMRGLIEIPLDGYLLTPVQRICKYPLQLAELLKYTKSEHPDYEKIKEALETMRGVAVLINERKRRMESLEKLAAWQQRVEGWEAEDLIEVSSQLIHQGEVIRVTTGMWTNNITLFLFDHQLVYCKKDILKRNTYVYKGRIYLDTSEVIDVPDGKDPQLGVTVRHCLKVYSCVRDKWLLFCCRNAEDKRQWLSAMAEERRLVKQDRSDGLEFPPAARQMAKISATRERCRPPSKPSNKTYKRSTAYDLTMLPNQQGAVPTTTNSLGRKVGTWFTFGSNKKGGRHSHTPPS